MSIDRRLLDTNSPTTIFLFIRELTSFKNQSYALTVLAGAYFIAPHVRPVDVQIYVHSKEDASTMVNNLNLQPISRHGNVKFVIPCDEGVFYGQQTVSLSPFDRSTQVKQMSSQTSSSTPTYTIILPKDRKQQNIDANTLNVAASLGCRRRTLFHTL